MRTIKERIEQCRKKFADHIATFKRYDGISTLDWREKNGSSHYYVRYVFDEQHCHMYISGDLGHAVVWLTESATLANLAGYVKSIDYFLEKVMCSTDKYTYDRATAYEVLEHKLMHIELDFDEDDEDAAEAHAELLEERRELIEDVMCNFDARNGFRLSNEQINHISEIDSDYYEWLWDAGMNVDERVLLWLVGLNMAYRQVRDDG